MKTRTFFFLAVLGFTLHLNAQEATRLYDYTRTFVEDGYTYQCDVPASAMVTLYNKENKLTYVDQIYKDTGEHYSHKDNVSLRTDAETDTWTRPLCFDIVNAAFTEAEAARTKGYSLTISMYINPDTGKVMEVNFNFVTFDPFATIPVSVYRQIEVELKKKIWFNISEEGKKLNYILLWWQQEIGETVGK